jgi:hypothetical protein
MGRVTSGRVKTLAAPAADPTLPDAAPAAAAAPVFTNVRRSMFRLGRMQVLDEEATRIMSASTLHGLAPGPRYDSLAPLRWPVKMATDRIKLSRARAT